MYSIANVLLPVWQKKKKQVGKFPQKTGDPRISLLSLLSGARGRPVSLKEIQAAQAAQHPGRKQNQFRPRSRYDQEAVFAMQSGI